MFRASDRSFSRRDTVALISCATVSIVFLMLSGPSGQAVSGLLRRTALAPLVWLQTQAELGRTGRARFQAVTAERDSAALTAQAVPVLRAENTRLRDLLALSRRLSTRFVAGEVLHQSIASDGRMLLINIGTREGVAPFQPVVAPEGMIVAELGVGFGTGTVLT